LSHILARMSDARQGFRSANSVDGDALEVFRLATAELEVNDLPPWAWKAAIVAGFSAMHQLSENYGGRLIVDLDARTLVYERAD